MKKFITNIALLVFPLLIVLVATNYFVDAARLFDNEYEKTMAKIISSGQNATNIQNYNERLFQKELISDSGWQPNLVIIGSSRTMLITSELVGDSTMSNNSVSGASLRDLIAVYQIYKDSSKLPKKIIVGIDPWLFNESRKDERWRSIEEYYHKFITKRDYQGIEDSNYDELFSLSYFQNSLKALPKTLLGQNQVQPSKKKYNYAATKLTDGSLAYGEKFRSASQKEIDNSEDNFLAQEIYGLKDFKFISERRWKIFNQLILDMEKNNIEIEFFLAPYSPKTFRKIRKDYPLVLEVEEKIRQFSEVNRIKIYGSYDPKNYDLDKTFFYDGMHAKESAIETIIEEDNDKRKD